MHKLLRYRSCNHLSRQAVISFTFRCLPLLTLFLGPIPSYETLAQTKPAAVGASSLCNRNVAVEMIGQQIAVTRTFDNAVRRTTVLIRAADILWPYQQDKSRAAFVEASTTVTITAPEEGRGRGWLSACDDLTTEKTSLR